MLEVFVQTYTDGTSKVSAHKCMKVRTDNKGLLGRTCIHDNFVSVGG